MLSQTTHYLFALTSDNTFFLSASSSTTTLSTVNCKHSKDSKVLSHVNKTHRVNDVKYVPWYKKRQPEARSNLSAADVMLYPATVMLMVLCLSKRAAHLAKGAEYFFAVFAVCLSDM